MTQRSSLLRLLCSLLLLATFAHGLRFELEARKAKDVRERCIRNFVGKDTLVVVTAIVSGNKGDGQTVNMQVCPALSSRRGARLRWMEGLGLTSESTDQGYARERVRTAEGRRGREADSIHGSRRRRL